MICTQKLYTFWVHITVACFSLYKKRNMTDLYQPYSLSFFLGNIF